MAYAPEEIQNAKNIIIEGISNGKSLLSLLNDKKLNLPSRPIIYNWLNTDHKDYDSEFFNNYTHAREDSADLDAEKAESIAEKVENGEIDPQQARVMLDVYKWTAGVKKPKKYGKTLDLTTNGQDLPSAQPTIVMQFTPPEDED